VNSTLGHLEELQVVRFRESDLPGDDELPHDIRWQEYHTVRNTVLEALRPFGRVGPMGTATITDSLEGPPDPWPVESDDPDLFVVDDMWNDWDRHIEVEVKQPGSLTTAMLHALRDALTRQHPQWAVGLSTTDGYVLIGTKRILVKGAAYRRCKTVGDIVRASLRAAKGT